MLRFGSPPFLANKIMLLCRKIVHDPVAWPRRIDDGVRALLEGMLAKDARERLTLPKVGKKKKSGRPLFFVHGT